MSDPTATFGGAGPLRPAASQAPIHPMGLPDARKYLIFGIIAFGQFMALIDIQNVAASSNDVQAARRGLATGQLGDRPLQWPKIDRNAHPIWIKGPM